MRPSRKPREAFEKPAHGGSREAARPPVRRRGAPRNLRAPPCAPLQKSGDMENTQAVAPEARPSDYVAEASFDSLGLSEAVRRAVAEKGYERPTPVQVQSFGPIRAGKDVIVRSKTGTGKTAAFAMPILDRIPEGRRKVSCLVMCPTRELAIQVAQEFEELAK